MDRAAVLNYQEMLAQEKMEDLELEGGFDEGDEDGIDWSGETYSGWLARNNSRSVIPSS